MGNEAPCNPVIVVPGIKAVELTDEYPTERDAVWSVVASLRQDFKRLALHPDDRRYERIEPARIMPGPAFGLVYDQFIAALRHELSPAEDRPTPVHAFCYDWRRGLADVQAQLAAFIDEVIDRTLLLRHYWQSDYRRKPRVNLVGHSMGGLVIAGLLADGGGARVGKVATIATPFQGSANAVLSIATGQSTLAAVSPSPSEREVARLLPAVYHLLPSYAGALAWPGGLARSFYKPLAWQPSVYETIAEYIRLYSRREASELADPADRIADAVGILRTILATAQKHRTGVDTLDLKAAGLAPTDWLAITGIGEPTVDRIVATTEPLLNAKAFAKAALFDDGQGMEIDLLASAPVNDYDPRQRERPAPRTGDGTVPLAGALPAFLPYEQLVAVTREHFAWWEIGDRLVNGVIDLHAALPRMNAVQSMIICHFLGTAARAVRALPAPGVAVDAWTPPVAGLVAG
jgi:pimeloyl-ACP methyl ester carboxylesterase